MGKGGEGKGRERTGGEGEKRQGKERQKGEGRREGRCSPNEKFTTTPLVILYTFVLLQIIEYL